MVLHNRNTDQRALKMSDLLSQRQFHRLELYDVVYRPARVEYLMTGGFEVSAAGDIVTLAFGRETTDFTEDERESAESVAPASAAGICERRGNDYVPERTRMP